MTRPCQRRYIVFLNIPASFHAAFQAARKLGLDILHVTTSSDAVLNPGVARQWRVDTIDFENVTTLLKGPIKDKSIVAFWALQDRLIPLVGKLNHELCRASIFPSADTIRRTKNKWLMRVSLARLEANPRFCLARAAKEVNIFKNGGKVVVKPPLGYASIGVEKVCVRARLSSAIRRTQSILPMIRKSIPSWECGEEDPPDNSVLVEDFVEGVEISAEVFATNGRYDLLGLCEKSPMRPPFFEEVSYCMPARRLPQRQTAIRAALYKALAALGFTDGAAHCELILSHRRIVLLDVGLRVGGSGLSHDLVYHSSGIPLATAALTRLIGRDPRKLLASDRKDVCLLYLYQVGPGGRVSSMPSVPESLRQHLIRAVNFVHPGDRLRGYPRYSGLPGYALFRIQGRGRMSYATADRILNDCREKLAISYATSR